MAVTIYVQGGSFELHESEKFNKCRRRLNNALKNLEDYRNGNIDGRSRGQRFEPFHYLTFFINTEDEDGEEAIGRLSVHPEKIIAIEADTRVDVAGSEDDDYDDDEDEDDEDE